MPSDKNPGYDDVYTCESLATPHLAMLLTTHHQ